MTEDVAIADMTDDQIEELISNLIEVYLDKDFLAGYMVGLGKPIDASIDLENVREAVIRWLKERVRWYAPMVELGLIDKPKAEQKLTPARSRKPGTGPVNVHGVRQRKTRTKKKSAKRQKRGGSSFSSKS